MRAQDSLRALLLAAVIAAAFASGSKECITAGAVTSKLFCYYSDATEVDVCKCSHIILPETTPLNQLKGLIDGKGAKVLLTVKKFNENLIKTLNATKVFGLEIQLKKMDSKQDITDFISTARTKLGSDLFIALSVPARPEVLAKYYDFKTLSKHADVFTLQTHFLGANRNVTFHPSRLSGLWDVQNTDSVVDLVTGLGAPLSKLVITTPVQAFKFQLQNQDHTAPGSPALELSTLTRDELCATMESDKWTLERDQDQAGPYIFREDKWISFEDATSMDIKAKYARVRGLAGLALKDISQDGGTKCGETLLEAAFDGLTKQARAPRGAVLHSLEREILETPARPFDNVQVSPYRISRVIDTEGSVHAIRKDTRTEFQCSRQGYFVHPRSCNRFYRCVKFDQQSDEFSVFEFDCPAGLAFDERVEVCVWPGSLPNGSACSGSSEIAPVPKERFVCPEIEGYYADPENCRWFFACMDHGKSPLTAYEFRCPYGLVFDQDNLLCEWSWLVPKCGSGLSIHEEYYGGYINAAGASGGIVGAGGHLEGRDGAFDLDLYDGLGSLNHIKLGGLSGPLHVTQAKTYSNYDHHNEQLLGLGVALSGGVAGLNNLSPHTNLYYQEGGILGSSNYATGENIAAAGVSGLVGNSAEGSSYDRNGAGRVSDNAKGFVYHDGQQLNHQTLNIVAGGSSGVASYAPKVDVLQHGLKIDVQSITPATLVSSTISPIPTVGHVPIPSRGHVDTYNLGVVANFPNLQYKLENPTIINHQLHHLNSGAGNLYSASNVSIDYSGYPTNSLHQYNYNQLNNPFDGHKFGFGSYESHTYNRPQHMLHGGYKYDKTNIVFDNKPLTPAVMKTYTYEQNLDGFHYNNPQVELQQPIAYQPVSYYDGKAAIPASTYQHVNIQPAQLYQQVKVQPAQGYQHVKVQPLQQSVYQEVNVQPSIAIKQEGYVYNKPQVAFVEGSKSSTNYQNVHLHQPSVSTHEIKSTGYHYNKPEIKFEEKPAVTPALTYQQVLQPVTTYHDVKIQPSIETLHQVHHQQQQYHYAKPAIDVQKSIIPATTYQEVNMHNVQPAVTYQHINHEVKKEGYHYDKPELHFESPAPATTYQEVKIQPQVTYHQQVNQEIKQGGYHYEKPAIKFEEKPIVPATTYQEINVQPIQPAVTYQHVNHEVKQEGYHYEKPAIKFEEKPRPATTFHEEKIQPTVTYQEVNHHVKQEGYHYQKPTIKFEERPIPTTTFHEVKVQPAVNYQQVNHEVKHEGYHYEKPAIAFEEKPVTIYQQQEVKVQPAVTYQDVKIHTAPTVTVHETKQEGYHYEKPTIAFEEKPVVPVTIHQEVHVQQPAFAYQEVKVQPSVTYQEVKHEVNEGYHYEKPKVSFEEKPAEAYLPIAKPTYLPPAPATTYQEIKVPAPAVAFAPQAPQQVIHSYSYEKPHVDQHIQTQSYHEIKHQPITTYQEVKHEGYHYKKPNVVFEEKPTPIVPVSTYQNVKVEPAVTYHYQSPQPAVSAFQEIKHEGYHYEKPKVVFEEKPAPIVPATTYQEININAHQKPQPVVNTYQEVKHEGYHYEKPKIAFEERPVPVLPAPTYQNVKIQPAVTYHNQKIQPAVQTFQEVKHEGYYYEAPKIAFAEKPAPVPATTYHQVKIQQPAVTYHYQKPQAPVTTYQEVKHEGYHYEKPNVVFEERPVPVTPATYVNYIQPQPTPILSTYHEVKPLLVEPKPTYKQIIQAVTPKPKTIVNSFSINQYSQGYHYDKPAIAFEENPSVKYLPAKPTYLPPRSNTALNYIPAKPALQYIPAKPAPTPAPTPAKVYLSQVPVQTYIPAPQPTKVYQPVKPVVSTYVKPVQTYYQEYYNAKEIVEQPIVKTKAYKTGYHYDKPAIKFEEYTTPKPTYPSTVASIITKIEPAPLQFFTFYDSRLEHVEPIKTVQPVKVIQPIKHIKVVQPIVQVQPIVHEIKTVPVTSKPIVRYEFSSLDYQPVQQQEFLINVPEREYLPVTRRPVIVTKKEYLPPRPPKRVYLPVTTTTEKYVEVTAPSREYLPVTQEILKVRTSTPAQEYLPATRRVRTRPTTTTTTTERPTREYLPAKSTPPPREYLPAKSTQPPREYLPAKSTQPPREYLPVKATSPPKEYLPVTPRPRKPNREYLPVQVENYEYQPSDEPIASTRKPKVIKVVRTRPIVKTNDFHPILAAKLGAQCTCTSNTLTLRRRRPQKDDATTRISDLEEYVPSEDQLELQYNKPRKESVIIVAEEEEDVNQDDEVRKQDIAKAVNSGLKLVKSAVKQGVKEGVQEALTGKDFDRYGPGGVRGRSETLQGTIDCQRAGLFRHPKHCNKFYACRWDEGKKKFTLHVFNCPVHLTFDNNLGACNWPSQGPACVDNTLLPSD